MNISKYKEAQKYAYAITTSEYLDILHDAYLHWNKYKQSDLFDQDIALICTVVKNVYKNQQTKEFTYQKDGVRYNREFVDVKPTNLIENKIEDNLHVDQAIDLLNKHLTPNQKLTFFYSLLGYKRKDIAKELNVREATIVDRFKLIQEKYRKLAL
jgi:DNA-directed RNA polymerase specialized sigma24 family protein